MATENGSNSKFIRLNNYCLVEYIYNDFTENTETDDYSMYLVDDKIAKIKQCYCADRHAYSKIYQTNNVEKNTCFPYTNNRYAVYDWKNSIFDYDTTNLIRSEIMGSSTTEYIHCNVDTVRFHFVSGYAITNLAALIFTVRIKETDSSYNFFLSTYVNAANYSDLIVYNPTPVYLTNAKFDRYIEYKIPSIKSLNNEYYTASERKNTAAAWLSRNNVTLSTDNSNYLGFIENAPITITLDECLTDYTLKTETNSYLFYNISQHFESSISQYNEYDYVNATIEEASDGNYFQYGMTYGDGSVENFIDRLSSNGDKWDIIHQLIVYENNRTGEMVQTFTITSYQEDDFDELMTFRPVLKNSSTDVSFSIDYQARLLNENTGEQIIRTSSCISLNVNRYGKNTIGISGIGDVKPYKIYNRLFKGSSSATELYEEPIFNDKVKDSSVSQIVENSVSYPLYVDYNKISVEPKVVLNESLSDTRIIFKQYDLRIILTPNDTYLQFTVYEENNGVLKEKDLNLSNVGIYHKLIFDIDNNAAKISIDAYTEDDTIKPNKGQLMFHITASEVEQILASSTNDFYIVSYNYATSKNNVLYVGYWLNQFQISDYKEHLVSIQKEYATEEENLRKIQELQEAYDNTEEITSDVSIPGYVDENSDGSETSNVLSIVPESKRGTTSHSGTSSTRSTVNTRN